MQAASFYSLHCLLQSVYILSTDVKNLKLPLPTYVNPNALLHSLAIKYRLAEGCVICIYKGFPQEDQYSHPLTQSHFIQSLDIQYICR